MSDDEEMDRLRGRSRMKPSADDSDEEDDAPDDQEVDLDQMTAEDADVRAMFPLSFGKGEIKGAVNHVEIHNTTVRQPAADALLKPSKKKDKKGGMKIAFGALGSSIGGPSGSVAAGAAEEAVGSIQRKVAPEPAPEPATSIGPLRPPAPGGDDALVGPPRPVSVDYSDLVGPPRPQPSEDMVGPPRPPVDDDMVGPPRPPVDEGMVGPPRPPVDEGMVGPPRPPVDEGMVGPPRPPMAEADEDMVGPPRPPVGGSSDDDDDDDGEDGDEEEEDPYHIPLSHEISLQGHHKVVSALAIDHVGTRVVSGGHDYDIKMFDFHGMKRDLKPFRAISEPCGGHPINAVSFSPSGDLFIVVPGSAQPKIYDRDGREEGEFPRGDMYIRDMRNTKGHVMGCTGGQWHPTERGEAISGSLDGTVRIWDVTRFNSQKTVLKPAHQVAKGRVGVTACCYSPDGRYIAAGMSDGSMQMWSATGKMASAKVGLVLPPKEQMHIVNKWSYSAAPKHVLRGAHAEGEETTGITISDDGTMILTRNTDGTLKAWDMRKLKDPLKTFADLHNNSGQTQVQFSPDNSLFFTGVSCQKDGTGGGLMFFERSSLAPLRFVAMPGNPVAMAWQPKINQILVGCGDRKKGTVQVLYDPAYSERGALQCMARAPRKPDPADVSISLPVHNPHALPMFREDVTLKRKAADHVNLKDPKVTKRPEQHKSGPGVGGRIGTTGGTLLTQHLMRQRGALGQGKDHWAEQDPRAAFLKHAEAAKANPCYTSAYRETQPEILYHQEEEEDEEK